MCRDGTWVSLVAVESASMIFTVTYLPASAHVTILSPKHPENAIWLWGAGYRLGSVNNMVMATLRRGSPPTWLPSQLRQRSAKNVQEGITSAMCGARRSLLGCS